jgi:hypothetical protein
MLSASCPERRIAGPGELAGAGSIDVKEQPVRRTMEIASRMHAKTLMKMQVASSVLAITAGLLNPCKYRRVDGTPRRALH